MIWVRGELNYLKNNLMWTDDLRAHNRAMKNIQKQTFAETQNILSSKQNNSLEMSNKTANEASNYNLSTCIQLNVSSICSENEIFITRQQLGTYILF